MKAKLFLLAIILLLVVACVSPPEPEITPQPAPMVGQPAPEFGWETPDGDKSLSDFQGKVVLLTFWSPYCQYCLKELPALKTVHERYGDGLVVIFVTSDASDTTGAWLIIKDEMGLASPVVTDPRGEIFDLYWVRGIPAAFVIDRKGIVRAWFDGLVAESQIEEVLAPLLELSLGER